MKNSILLVAMAGAALLPAQKIDVKTGLWETTTTTESSGMPSMPGMDLSKLPPEKRGQIEAMVKARQAKGPQVHTSRNCVTQDQLSKQLFQDNKEEPANCKRTIVSSTSSTQDVKIECTGARKMSGEAKFTATSRESVT